MNAGGQRLRDFAERYSHALRTPLNGIHAWAHMLEARLPADDPVARRALDGILQGVAQQVRVLDELLETAQRDDR